MVKPLLKLQSCLQCAQVKSATTDFCIACLDRVQLRPHRVLRENLAEGFVACDYDQPLAELLHHFKVGTARSFAKWMAEQLSAYLPEPSERRILIPVPSSALATRRRGFVPAADLARAIARTTTDAKSVEGLWMSRIVADQAGLSVATREQNLYRAITASPSLRRLKNCEIVLVDDVITTGASMRECQRALGEVGLNTKYLFAFAETLRKNERNL